MYGSTGTYKAGYGDIESGYAHTALYPGISAEDNTLRWAFIRKVYGILSTQLLLTAVVGAVVALYTPIQDFFRHNPFVLLAVGLFSIIMLCPLYYYHQSHPVNLVLLGLFTVGISLTVGLTCAFESGNIVLEALLLTSVVVVSLTAYTYWASQRGYDFSFLGPFLFVSLMVLVMFGIIRLFFPSLGPLSATIYGGISALIFCGYIVYDTDNLIKRYSIDEYIWASVALYLDIINLFLSLLQILRGLQSD
eukprot:TRINITY_DN1139_c0_g1_i2.p1 TRINITY_DN1139_c0_g1~~TRINITY_DN1139_c0_g1_i2.p1  ORF type:complete len:249 (-),score=11.41 TRINITY_DN1139_c0_g1_i2:611-1357(-)